MSDMNGIGSIKQTVTITGEQPIEEKREIRFYDSS